MPVSLAVSARDRERFQGEVRTARFCVECKRSFIYHRWMGRTRDYCTLECRNRARNARRRGP
jgi:hypothetical protein